MRKVLIATVAMLALLLGSGLFPAIPSVKAADVCLSKDTIPGSPHQYHIGDTIHYVMTVHNPNETQSMTVDIWDELPPYKDNPNAADFTMLDDEATFAPKETRTYYIDYVVRASDLEQLWVEGRLYNVVVNTLRVHGEQHYGLIDAEVTKPSIVIQPNTLINIWPNEEMVPVGESVDVTITEKNTGDVSLTAAHVDLFRDEVLVQTLGHSGASFSGGNSDNVLDPGEIWTWRVTTSPLEDDTTFKAIGHGIDPLGLDVTYDNGFTGERDQVTVPVIWPNPDSLVTITADRYVVHTGEEIEMTVKEKNTGNVPLTEVFVELLADGVSIDTLAHASATSSGNGDNILDPGETWTWTMDRIITNNTTFLAIGHGLDPAGLDITPVNGFEDETDEITVTVVHPNTEVNITCTDDEVLLTITETNTGDAPLTGVYIELFANGTSVSKLYASSASSKGNGDNTLDPGETWTWIVSRCISATTTFVAVGHGLDPTGLDITFDNGFVGERDQVTLRIICLRPDTMVTISSQEDHVLAGEPFNLCISEKNTGCVSLTEAYVEVFADGVLVETLTYSSAEPSDGNSDDILDPGETWTWTVNRSIESSTTFVAIGHGMDPDGFDITYENGFLHERDEFTVDIISVFPDSVVTMTADKYWIYTEQEVKLTISEENTGYLPLTEVHVELFADGAKINTLTHASASPTVGNGDNVLEPGEIWTWTVNRTITDDTVFEAVGHGLDPSEVDITPANGFDKERDEITVDLLAPDTEVDVASSLGTVYQGQSFVLTIMETNTGQDPLTDAYVELFANGSSFALLYASSATPSNGDTDDILDPGETWTWTVNRSIASDTTFVAVGHGRDAAGLDITYDNGFPQERKEITVTVICPNPATVVTIGADDESVDSGDTVEFTITEENTGNVPLTSVRVEVFADGSKVGEFDRSTAACSGGNSNNVLDPGETWTWTFNRTVTDDTTFVAIGHGLDTTQVDITYPAFEKERDEITISAISRGIEVTLGADSSRVCDCESFDLAIGMKNTGDVALTGAYVQLFANGASVDKFYVASATVKGNGDDILDPGETWEWMVAQSISVTTTFVGRISGAST